VDTMHAVAPEPSASSGKGYVLRKQQVDEPRHKTPRTARKSKVPSLVLEQFFPVRKRICLDRDEKAEVRADRIAETTVSQEMESLFARPQGRLPSSNRSSPSKALEYMELIGEEKSELALDIAQASLAPLQSVPALSTRSEAFIGSEQKLDEAWLNTDSKAQEVLHDQLSSHEELSFVEVGCHVDVKAMVESVGGLQMQVLPLQPGESTATRHLTLRFHDNFFCEWRLWGDDAKKYGDALLSQEVLVLGAKLYKVNGQISLNGCTSVSFLRNTGHTTARTDINSCLSLCRGST